MEQVRKRNQKRNKECVCKVCGKVFLAKRKNAFICSEKCRNLHRTKHILYTKNCIICGATFSTYAQNRLLCGKKPCQLEYNRRRTRKYLETHKKPKVERVYKTKEQTAEMQKKWRETHKEYLREYRKKYNKEHRPEINAQYKKRLNTDICFRLRQNLCKRIQRAITKGFRSQHTLDLLGCTLEEFKTHIESQFQEGMSWENYGKQGWVIDHIIPCASFNLADEEEQKICFNYKNMQPLWNSDNAKKNDFLPNGKRARDLK